MNVNDFDTKDGGASEVVAGNPTPPIDPNIKLANIAKVLDGDIEKNSKELGAIYDFVAKEMKDPQDIDVQWGIRELLLRLGTPKFGESNLDRLYQYVYLRTEKDKIDNRLNMLGGKNE